MKKKLRKLRRTKEIIKIYKGHLKFSRLYMKIESETDEDIEFYGRKGTYYYNRVFKRKGNLIFNFINGDMGRKYFEEKIEFTKLRIKAKVKKRGGKNKNINYTR